MPASTALSRHTNPTRPLRRRSADARRQFNFLKSQHCALTMALRLIAAAPLSWPYSHVLFELKMLLLMLRAYQVRALLHDCLVSLPHLSLLTRYEPFFMTASSLSLTSLFLPGTSPSS